MKMTIKTGDLVYVITGKDKGKQGKVLEVNHETNRVTVDGVNVVKKHQKPRNQQDKGGIISKVAPIDASNVMVVCPSCGKPSRIAHKEVNGKKVRVCKKCGTSLDKEFVKASKKEAKKATEAKTTVKAEPKAETKTTKTVEKKETASKTAEKKTTTTKTTAKPAAEKTATKAAPKKSTTAKKTEA